MNNIINRVWNRGTMVNIEDLRGSLYQNEQLGHTFVISGVDGDGNVVSLSGIVDGAFLRPDNTTVAISGSASGGKAYVTLPANCYDVPGKCGLTIYLTADSQKTALYAAVVTVTRTSSNTASPGTTASVVDLVNAINAAISQIPATDTAIKAAMAPTYSNTGLYAVGSYAWYNGVLKRCIVPITTAESYTAAHWTDAALGNDLRDLKSALFNLAENEDIAFLADETGKYIKKDGTYGTSSAYRTSDFVEIPECVKSIKAGNYYKLGDTAYHVKFVCTFYEADKTTVAGYIEDNTNNIATGDVPSGAKYLKFNQANDGNASVNSVIGGFWLVPDYVSVMVDSWKTLTVAKSPNLDSNSVDFHNLDANKIYYRTSTANNPSNQPFSNFRGLVVTMRGVSADTADYVFAVPSGSGKEIYYCRSTGVPKSYSEWRKIVTSDTIRNAIGYIGSDTITFTTTKEIKDSTIILAPLTKYLVRVSKYRDGAIRLFPKTDSSEYAQLEPYQNEIVVYNNVNANQYLSAYNKDGTADEIDLSVFELGSVESKIFDVPVKYTVSKNSHNADFTSVTACFLALKDDRSPKIVEIWEGDYDIYQEYQDANVPVNTEDDPIADFPPYCVFIPENTHVVGKGIVRLKWMPTKANNPEITWKQCQAVSPVNVMGSMTLENVEIHCKNGRYCIHNDTIGLAPYAGSVQHFINVKCFKYDNEIDTVTSPGTKPFGTKQTIGFGMGKSMLHVYDDCLFVNYAEGRAFYGHSNIKYNGTNITEQESGEIILNNCIMDTEGIQCVKLGNAGSTQLQIKVRFNNCYFSNRIDLIDESGGGSKPNSFDVTFLNCGDVNVKVGYSGNIYPPKGYRTNITIITE